MQQDREALAGKIVMIMVILFMIVTGCVLPGYLFWPSDW
jgi:hypothetical protein